MGDIRVVYKLEGSYNWVHILEVADGRNFAIRVPAMGWKARWTAVHAKKLKCEAATMQYLRNKVGLPVPEVITSDNPFNNHTNAPFFLMTCLPGQPICDVWDSEEDLLDGFTYVDRNLRVLSSLEKEMGKVESLEFDKLGDLCFSNGPNRSRRQSWSAISLQNPRKPSDHHWSICSRWNRRRIMHLLKEKALAG